MKTRYPSKLERRIVVMVTFVLLFVATFGFGKLLLTGEKLWFLPVLVAGVLGVVMDRYLNKKWRDTP